MYIAIVEDQSKDIMWLKHHIEAFMQTEKIQAHIECFINETTFMKQFVPGKYTLIFLDIYLGEENGMELAQKIRKSDRECLLVFVTLSDSHAIESYEVRAFYYLKKPLEAEDLFHVLRLCENTLKYKASFIQIKEGRIMVKILVSEILYADTDRHYVQIHTINGIRRSRMKFDELWKMLVEDSRFLICYRNTMVNMDYINYINKKDIVLTTGEIVIIQRNRYTQIRQSYCDYCFEKMKGSI